VAETSPQQLLLHAVDAMPAQDRERILVWLLDRSFSASELPGMAGMSAAVRRELVESMPALMSSGGEALLTRTVAGARRGEHQVVPIRLPTEQHAALREWCSAHGFSMATVVRGLVERFLEEQSGR
jgi:hypothetical protein